MDLQCLTQKEWLEADGMGGFASGTAAGLRTRRYHALLLTAVTPPTGRVVLVNGFDAWVTTSAGSVALSSQRYAPDVIHPDGARRIESFAHDPWPRWIFRLDDGTHIEHEVFVRHGSSMTALSCRVHAPHGTAWLTVRPFLTGRDYHALHHENPAFQFTPAEDHARLTWSPYPGVPGVVSLSNGFYRHHPEWYRNVLYTEERVRGLDDTEDVASPGELKWDVTDQKAVWILASEKTERPPISQPQEIEQLFNTLRASELRRRRKFVTPLIRSADAYIVRRQHRVASAEGQTNTERGTTIIAGYPWFTDWGRDTFIALRGLCIATGRLDVACHILREWANTISQGMVPNRFPDGGNEPEYNSVDASLWYIIALHDYLCAAQRNHAKTATRDRTLFDESIEAILSGYAAGTRFGIHLDTDGLLACGQTGVQLTWMDAKIGDRVVTPRIGKPVEVQALWLNALKIGGARSARWRDIFQRGAATFEQRFWCESGYLYDVVDCDHQKGAVDASFRPNQIFAVGGLPYRVLQGPHAREVVEAVEQRLWTPMGLRSLAPGEPGYVGVYHGGVPERDGAYHQGTVWPWLAGPFIEAWVRVHGETAQVKRTARERWLDPLLRHMNAADLGHLPEIADAEAPYTPRGCPFQAWSVGEALRVRMIVTENSMKGPRR